MRLTQKAKGDVKREAESTAQSIISALSTEDADRIVGKIKINTQRVFNTTKDSKNRSLKYLLAKNRRPCHYPLHRLLAKLTELLVYLLGPLVMPR